jgi:anti-anti-sigma factor
MTWILLAAVLAAVAWAVAGELDAPAWVKASAAGLAAASAGVAKLLERNEGRVEARRVRERTLHEHLRFWSLPGGRLLHVEEVDRRSLGVESQVASAFGDVALGDTYVPRSEDSAVRQALRDRTFTLLVGGSKVGKTRTAYEAVSATYPGHNLIVPEKAGSLLEILTVEPPLDLGHAVVWLDDLDVYLERDTGLSLNFLAALSDRAPPARVMATMATSEFDLHRAARGVSKNAQLVLARADTIFLEPLTDMQRVRRTLGSVSEGFGRNVAAYGLGATLAAGPELLRRLNRRENSAGVAIVRAAADWRRAGVSSPIPEDLLEQLFESYLRADRPTSGETFRAGLEWALFEIHQGAALLERRSARPEYVAADYVVEYIEHQRGDVRDAMWRQALSFPDVESLLSVGLSAYLRDRLDIAESAFRAAADAGSQEGAYNLAVVLEDLGRSDGAGPVLDELKTVRDTTGFDLITHAISDEVTVVRPVGELDLYTAPELKRALLDAIQKGARYVIVDLTDTTYIESATLGVLVGALKRLRANDGLLLLVCPDRNLRKIFSITGLDRAFSISLTLEEATDSLARE